MQDKVAGPDGSLSGAGLGPAPKRDIVERLREISGFRAAFLEQTGMRSNLPCIKADAANEIERLREALDTAGAALHRWVISAYDNDDRAQQQHVRDVGLEAVKFALRPN